MSLVFSFRVTMAAYVSDSCQTAPSWSGSSCCDAAGGAEEFENNLKPFVADAEFAEGVVGCENEESSDAIVALAKFVPDVDR